MVPAPVCVAGRMWLKSIILPAAKVLGTVFVAGGVLSVISFVVDARKSGQLGRLLRGD